LRRFGGGPLIVITRIFKEPFRGNITPARLKLNGGLLIGSENFIFLFLRKLTLRVTLTIRVVYITLFYMTYGYKHIKNVMYLSLSGKGAKGFCSISGFI